MQRSPTTGTKGPPLPSCVDQHEAQIPFGGTKASGYGRFGGRAAINEFTELHWITIETEPHQHPFYFAAPAPGAAP